MPAFEYEALDLSGRSKRGIISAETQRQARRELRRINLTPVRLSAPRSQQRSAAAFARRKHISSAQLVMITRQLAALLGAATPLEEALNAVAAQSEQSAARTRLLSVRERVMEGWRFADALGEDPKSFPDLYRAVIAAGEMSGDLSGVLDRLATMLEKNRAIKNKAIASLIYPAVLAFFAASVLTALMVFVVPKIVEQFNAFDAKLPVLTQIVVAISEWIGAFGLYFVLGAVVLGAGAWRALKEPKIKIIFDRYVLRIPIFGRLSRAVDGARFARTLSTLFSGGAPLIESITGAQRTVSNTFIRDRLNITVTMVSEGSSVAAGLRRAGELPPMLTHMIAAGERAGALPGLLEKAALQLEEEFDTASTVALRLLEPGIIAVMGGGVLVIVLSILLPVLRLNSLAAGG